MLAIRLTRIGKKNSPAYRVVVAEKRRAVKRKFVEILGHYNPTYRPKEMVIDKERALFWLGRGAQASPTVWNLMCDFGVLDKKQKIDKRYAKTKLSEEAKEKAIEKKEGTEVAEQSAETETVEAAEQTEEEIAVNEAPADLAKEAAATDKPGSETES